MSPYVEKVTTVVLTVIHAPTVSRNYRGNQSRRTVQIWRGHLQPRKRSNSQFRGEAAGVRLQQDQRRDVHFQHQYFRQDRTEGQKGCTGRGMILFMSMREARSYLRYFPTSERAIEHASERASEQTPE